MRPLRPERARIIRERAAVKRRPPEHVVAALVLTVLLLLAAAVARAEDDRTLEAVTIEGEVRLPQVLFITSREVDRPMDWLDHYDVPLAVPAAITPGWAVLAAPDAPPPGIVATPAEEKPGSPQEDSR